MKQWITSPVGLLLLLSLLPVHLSAASATYLTPDEQKNAKALDEELAKECQKGRDECRYAYAALLFQAQVRFADWGYGVKITADPDPDTVAAIRLYQHRNGLPETGKIDGLTAVRMDADEEAVKPYPFTLPSFTFVENWSTSYFHAMGVFRDTSAGLTSGPTIVECYGDWRVCFEEESSTFAPNIAKMNIKEWTPDHIVAEEEALCYTNQLRIERASKTVIDTSIRTRKDGPCSEGVILSGAPDVVTEELVDGVTVQLERNAARAAAVRRVKIVSGYAKQQMESGQR